MLLELSRELDGIDAEILRKYVRWAYSHPEEFREDYKRFKEKYDKEEKSNDSRLKGESK